jgi:hypothetical protein
MEKISWTDREKEIRSNTQSHGGEKYPNWIGHILRRCCLLKDFTEGKLEGRIKETERRGRRCKQLLDDLKETRGYFKFKV